MTRNEFNAMAPHIGIEIEDWNLHTKCRDSVFVTDTFNSDVYRLCFLPGRGTGRYVTARTHVRFRDKRTGRLVSWRKLAKYNSHYDLSRLLPFPASV